MIRREEEGGGRKSREDGRGETRRKGLPERNSKDGSGKWESKGLGWYIASYVCICMHKGIGKRDGGRGGYV